MRQHEDGAGARVKINPKPTLHRIFPICCIQTGLILHKSALLYSVDLHAAHLTMTVVGKGARLFVDGKDESALGRAGKKLVRVTSVI